MSKRTTNIDDVSGRRLISDLIDRYNDHVEFRDVYVEGKQDQDRVRCFLMQHQMRYVAVYEIDSVHLPMELLQKHGLSDGQKGRIVALARELEGKIPLPEQVTCVGDSDCDILPQTFHQAASLVLTEYSCHEMYYFNVSTMSKFLAFSVPGCKVGAEELIAATAQSWWNSIC